MDPQAQARAAVGGEPVANSDDCDLNDLARMLRRLPGNLLPPEPFPSGFDLGALAASRSSHPPAPASQGDAEARLDLRSMGRSKAVAQPSSAPPRRLPPRKDARVVDLAPQPIGDASAPPRTLPARKRSVVVDLAPAQAARPSEHADDVDALVAGRAFASDVAWPRHLARVTAAAQQAPRWAWATGGALLVACVWMISGSHQAPAAATNAGAAVAPSPVYAQPAPATSLASIFARTNVAAVPRDARLAYERARPVRSRPETAATPEPSNTRAQAPAAETSSLSTEERSIDTLLDQALRNEGSPVLAAPAPRAKAGSGVQQLPSRAVVADVFGALLSRVRFCAGQRSGVAIAHVVVRKDGYVTSARISGAPFSSSAAGRCMESVLRQARFPAFEQPTFSVTYPFQL
jgi:hypothetical protein